MIVILGYFTGTEIKVIAFFINRIKRKVNGRLQTESEQLRNAFNNMDMLRTPAQSVDALLRGLTDGNSEKMDGNFVDDVSITNKYTKQVFSCLR